jgi:hypothetical protein
MNCTPQVEHNQSEKSPARIINAVGTERVGGEFRGGSLCEPGIGLR